MEEDATRILDAGGAMTVKALPSDTSVRGVERPAACAGLRHPPYQAAE
jgi:hypothetical protein